MPHGTALEYRYDGSYTGFLCLLADCLKARQLPGKVSLLDEPQAGLLPLKAVTSDPERARSLEEWFRARAGQAAARALREGFLTCMAHKEPTLLRFALEALRAPGEGLRHVENRDVGEVLSAIRFLQNEASKFTEFLRFSDAGGVLVAQITPKNNVLPLVAPHFCARLPEEEFLIFEKSYGLGFLHRRGTRGEFFYAERVELPAPGAEEERFRALWRRFYDAVAVEGRQNPKLRRNHMPMRYWAEMTEMQEAAGRR